MRDSLLKCLALLALVCCAVSSGTCAWILWRTQPCPARLSKQEMESTRSEWAARRLDWIRDMPSTTEGSSVDLEVAHDYIAESERIIRNAEDDILMLRRAVNREDDTAAIAARLRGHRLEWENTRWRK